MPVIQLQGLVRRTGAVVEELAPARFGGFVFCPMKNEQRQSDAHELFFEPLVRTNQLRNRLGRLRLVREVLIQRADRYSRPLSNTGGGQLIRAYREQT